MSEWREWGGEGGSEGGRKRVKSDQGECASTQASDKRASARDSAE